MSTVYGPLKINFDFFKATSSIVFQKLGNTITFKSNQNDMLRIQNCFPENVSKSTFASVDACQVTHVDIVSAYLTTEKK